MSIPVINYPVNFRPYSNVQPFTLRDNVSQLEIVEGIRVWIRDTLIPHVNDEISGLAESWGINVTEIRENFDTIAAELNAHVEAAIEGIGSQVADAQAARVGAEAAEQRAADLVSQAEGAQDGNIKIIIETVNSATRNALNNLYAPKSLQDTVTTGRLSQTELDNHFSEFFADEFGGLAGQITAAVNSITGLDNRLDAVEEAASTETERVNAEVAKLTKFISGKADFAEMNFDPSQWGGPTGTGLTIPTHVTNPATNQVAHPSILFFPEGWNGYRYWMAYTPYPGNDDDHEDPNLAVSQDGITWAHAPGVTQPLDDLNGVPYNSDTELVMGPDDTMYLFWRTYDSSLSANQEKVYFRTSKNGRDWATKALAIQANEADMRFLGPTLVFENNRWTLWYVNQQGSTRTFMRATSQGATPTSWNPATATSIGPIISGKQVWHAEVRKIGSVYVSLMNVINSGTGGLGGLIQLMVSRDGVTWEASADTVIPQVKAGQHNHLYRATFVPEYKDGVLGLRVWYSAFQDSPSPYVWNIFRTWIGPGAGRGKPVTLTGRNGFTLSNQKFFIRGDWLIGHCDVAGASALSHGVEFASFPADVQPMANDVWTALSSGTLPFMGVIAENGLLVGNQPPAGRTAFSIRVKCPIVPK